jgi:hypothetical protein
MLLLAPSSVKKTRHKITTSEDQVELDYFPRINTCADPDDRGMAGAGGLVLG